MSVGGIGFALCSTSFLSAVGCVACLVVRFYEQNISVYRALIPILVHHSINEEEDGRKVGGGWVPRRF